MGTCMDLESAYASFDARLSLGNFQVPVLQLAIRQAAADVYMTIGQAC